MIDRWAPGTANALMMSLETYFYFRGLNGIGIKMEGRKVKDISIQQSMTIDQLMRQMGESGGFTGRKLADAVDIMEKMERSPGCLRFLSFPACIMATGTRGVIVELVKRKLVDVIITTCGTLDHDLARTWRHYYHGDFNMDDAELRREG